MANKAIRPIRIEGNIAYVPLTQGYEAVIDAADVSLVVGYNWRARVSRRQDGSVYTVYAVRCTPRGDGGKQFNVPMHRVIASTPADLDTDHINGDGLDNRRGNLRTVTTALNARNRRRAANNTSGVKGVCWDARKGKWRARIRADGRCHLNRYFDTIEGASEAYAAASAAFHQEFGRVA